MMSEKKEIILSLSVSFVSPRRGGWGGGWGESKKKCKYNFNVHSWDEVTLNVRATGSCMKRRTVTDRIGI